MKVWWDLILTGDYNKVIYYIKKYDTIFYTSRFRKIENKKRMRVRRLLLVEIPEFYPAPPRIERRFSTVDQYFEIEESKLIIE